MNHLSVLEWASLADPPHSTGLPAPWHARLGLVVNSSERAAWLGFDLFLFVLFCLRHFDLDVFSKQCCWFVFCFVVFFFDTVLPRGRGANGMTSRDLCRFLLLTVLSSWKHIKNSFVNGHKVLQKHNLLSGIGDRLTNYL